MQLLLFLSYLAFLYNREKQEEAALRLLFVSILFKTAKRLFQGDYHVYQSNSTNARS